MQKQILDDVHLMVLPCRSQILQELEEAHMSAGSAIKPRMAVSEAAKADWDSSKGNKNVF